MVFPPVDADSKVDTSENPIQEVLVETVEKKKKPPKQKVGFRDRKVLEHIFTYNQPVILVCLT